MSFELNLEGEGLERLLRRAERASGRNASRTWWLLDWSFKSQYANIDGISRISRILQTLPRLGFTQQCYEF